jgi:hypothetical protein
VNRETAWRVFAGEYNDSTLDMSDGGERSPTYVVTPLGAKVNRLFVVGVLTDMENVGTEQGPMWRGRITDPTGTFHVYAGQFQPTAAAVMSKLKPPVFAAISGKSRVYKPDSGATYVSIRPEIVKVVDANMRDYWVLESCQSLKKRLEAAREAYQMNPPTVGELLKLGCSSSLSAGLVAAVAHYGNIDLSRYSSMLAESLRYLLPEFQESRPPETEEVIKVEEKVTAKAPEKGVDDQLEAEVLALIEQLDKDGKGASWDAILEGAKKHKVDRDKLEELVNVLLDKGLVYEPVLGRMKKI